MNKTQNNIFKRCYNWFLNVDLYQNYKEDTNNRFYLHFLCKSLFIFLSLFLSFVFPVLNFLPLVITTIIILSEKSYNRVYYFILITPFWFVFKYIYVIYGIICFLWVLKILRDWLNNNLIISKRLMAIVAIISIYCMITMKSSIPGYTLLFCAVTLFLFLFLYRDKIDLTRLAIVASVSIIYSAILGLLGMLLNDFYPFSTAFYYGNGNYRFNSCVLDPNFSSVLCVSVFSILTFLFLNKNINLTLYCSMLPIFLILNIISGSKMGFFIMAFVLLSVLILLLFSKNNNKWKAISIILAISLVCCVVFFKNLQFMFSRMSIQPATQVSSPAEGVNFESTHPYLNSILISKFGQKLSSITTYRFNLWMFYLGYLLENPLVFLFGYGKTKIDIDIIINNQVLRQAHNSIIDMVLVYGLIFLVLISIIFAIFIKYKRSTGCRFNKLSIIPILCIIFAICSISLFWSGIFLLLVTMLMFTLFKKRGESSEDINNQ